VRFVRFSYVIISTSRIVGRRQTGKKEKTPISFLLPHIASYRNIASFLLCYYKKDSPKLFREWGYFGCE